MKILPVVVVYNMDFAECAIFKQLVVNNQKQEFLLYDNSPSFINEKYNKGQIIYYHNPKNEGVTAAYNYGAEYAKTHGYKYIVLFDQDTIFPSNYLDILAKYIKDYPRIKCFAPIIKYSENIPFSPVKISNFNSKAIPLQSGIYPLSNYSPVNSGACINVDSFWEVEGYNKFIKLDFADFDFFQKLKDTTPVFCLMNTIAYQQFSNTERNINKLLKRFKIYLLDAKNTNRKYRWQVLRHTLALTYRTKSILFIKYYLSTLK